MEETHGERNSRDATCSRARHGAAPRRCSRSRSRAQPPAAAAITPALIEAAKKEGKVAFYTAMDLQFAQQMGKAFEAKFPGIAVRVERSGAERIFTRIAQEYSSNIHAVDVVNTADAAIASSGSATAGSRRTCRRTSPSTSTRPTTTPTRCM